MILVDPRVGSHELQHGLMLEDLKALKLPVEERRLEYADFEFKGNGPRGECLIGIERKRLKDALNSIQSGRLTGHQLPGMSDRHEFMWLIVEGIWRPNPETGVLEEPHGNGWRGVTLRTKGFMYQELDSWLTTISMTRTRIKLCRTQRETAWTIHNLYWWFQREWRDHHSLQIVYYPAPPVMTVEKPGFRRRVAALIPQIGWEKSARVEQKFKSVTEMCLSPARVWREIDGVGADIAKRAVAILNGEGDR